MIFLNYKKEAMARVGQSYMDDENRIYRVRGVDFAFTKTFLLFFSRNEIGLTVVYTSTAEERVIPYSKHRRDKLVDLEKSLTL